LKRSPLLILLALPLLVFAGWFAYEQLPRFIWPAPVWLDPGSDSAVPGTCEVRNSLALVKGRFVAESAPLSADESVAQARAIIAETYSPIPDNPTVNSTLVRATFPGAGERLAWLHVIAIGERGENQPGKTAIVYLDAQAGDLLSLVTAGAAEMPSQMCGAPTGRRVLLRQFAPLVAIVGYVGMLVVGGNCVGSAAA
jgi:hypothetical protein